MCGQPFIVDMIHRLELESSKEYLYYPLVLHMKILLRDTHQIFLFLGWPRLKKALHEPNHNTHAEPSLYVVNLFLVSVDMISCLEL